MIPYIVMIAIPGMLAFRGARRGGLVLLLVAILYWLMIGFRFHIGMDWNNYLRIYERTQHLSTGDVFFEREPGFSVLNWLAAPIGGFVFVNVFSALIFCWGFFEVAKRCREPFIAVTVATPLLVVGFAMSGTRQAIALGIIFYLFATWENRRVWGRIALVLLASLFHFSAIFVLVFVALSANVSLVIRAASMLLIAPIILLIIRFAPSSMDTYTETYAGPQRLTAPGAIVQVGVIAIPALFYLVRRRAWAAVNDDSPLFRDLAIASIVALPVIFVSSVGAYRFALYFWPVAMYIWAGVPAMISNAFGRALYRSVIVFASLVLLIGWLAFANNRGAWLPYENWLLQPDGAQLFRHQYSH
jgi:hypothetical protein